MKLLLAVLAIVSFGIFVPNSYADPVLTLNTNAGLGVLTELPVVGNVYSWTYVDDYTAIGVYAPLPIVWSVTDNNVFDATFVYNPGGLSVLTVTDICANAAVLAKVTPCNLGLSFSDTAVGAGYLDGSNTPLLMGDLDVNLGADVGVGVVGIDLIGLDIGGGKAVIDFPTPAATPEPGTLSLMGTGLLGIAGVLRRKFRGQA